MNHTKVKKINRYSCVLEENRKGNTDDIIKEFGELIMLRDIPEGE